MRRAHTPTTASTQAASAERRARRWEELASRTRLASNGVEMRALYDDSRTERYVTASVVVPLGQLEILERGTLSATVRTR
jgi:hypothetical protein